MPNEVDSSEKKPALERHYEAGVKKFGSFEAYQRAMIKSAILANVVVLAFEGYTIHLSIRLANSVPRMPLIYIPLLIVASILTWNKKVFGAVIGTIIPFVHISIILAQTTDYNLVIFAILFVLAIAILRNLRLVAVAKMKHFAEHDGGMKE